MLSKVSLLLYENYQGEFKFNPLLAIMKREVPVELSSPSLLFLFGELYRDNLDVV